MSLHSYYNIFHIFTCGLKWPTRVSEPQRQCNVPLYNVNVSYTVLNVGDLTTLWPVGPTPLPIFRWVSVSYEVPRARFPYHHLCLLFSSESERDQPQRPTPSFLSESLPSHHYRIRVSSVSSSLQESSSGQYSCRTHTSWSYDPYGVTSTSQSDDLGKTTSFTTTPTQKKRKTQYLSKGTGKT